MTFTGPARTVLESLRSLPVEDRAKIQRLEAAALATEISQAAPTASVPRRAKAKSALKQGVAETLVLGEGGIFLGEKQLKQLGVISKDVTLPPVPDQFSKVFLTADHPVRRGKIAEHIILGCNPTNMNWYCFEKSIVPGSLGADGEGLSGPEQDKLLLGENGRPRIVQGMTYASPADYRPIKRVLNNVITLQLLENGGSVETLPFYGVYGRTADTQNADSGPGVLLGYFNRVLLGYSNRNGSNAHFSVSERYTNADVGLLAGWNLKFDR